MAALGEGQCESVKKALIVFPPSTSLLQTEQPLPLSYTKDSKYSLVGVAALGMDDIWVSEL